MKKGLSLGIVILMTALLCACGEETSKEGGETGNGAAGAANTENAWNIYTYSEAENGNRITSNDYAVSSEEELADLLKNAETELQLPSYIPSGYEFENGNFSYYVTGEILDQAEISETTGDNGKSTYVYTLPDDVLKQADGFAVTYSDGEDKKITVEVSCVQSMDMDTGNLSFEEVNAGNYDLGRSGASEGGYLGEFFREAQPIYEYNGEGSEIERKVIFVRIWMTDTDSEEVVKIAESM